MSDNPFNDLLLQRLSSMSDGISKNTETLAKIETNQVRNTSDLLAIGKRLESIEKKPTGLMIDPRSAKDWLTKLGPFILVVSAAIAKCFGLSLPMP